MPSEREEEMEAVGTELVVPGKDIWDFLAAGVGEGDERGRLRGGGLMGLVRLDILKARSLGLETCTIRCVVAVRMLRVKSRSVIRTSVNVQVGCSQSRHGWGTGFDPL